jgi:hypothetical protein
MGDRGRPWFALLAAALAGAWAFLVTTQLAGLEVDEPATGGWLEFRIVADGTREMREIARKAKERGLEVELDSWMSEASGRCSSSSRHMRRSA